MVQHLNGQPKAELDKTQNVQRPLLIKVPGVRIPDGSPNESLRILRSDFFLLYLVYNKIFSNILIIKGSEYLCRSVLNKVYFFSKICIKMYEFVYILSDGFCMHKIQNS